MGATELAGRVFGAGVLAVAAVVALAAALLGVREAMGVAAGGAIAFGNFRWLARDAARLGTLGAGRRLPLLGLRQLVAFGALAALIVSGFCHPLAVVAGLALLPPVLVVQGLRAAAR
jgi:hypothetical protein